MIVAERDGRCGVVNDEFFTAIPIDLKGWYSEFQISNNTTGPLFVLFVTGEKKRIDVGFNGYHEKHVGVTTRSVHGERLKSHNGDDITRVPKRVRKIPEEVLREGPIFIIEHNVVLCRPEFLDTAFHPHSREFRNNEMWRMHQAMADNCAEMPYIIVANDPTKRYPYLYVEVNGRVCAVKVANCTGPYEDDRVSVTYRDVVDGNVVYNTHRTSFSELLAEDSDVWEIHGHLISVNREHLQTKLELKNSEYQGVGISPKQHKEDIDRLKALHRRSVTGLEDEIEHLRSLDEANRREIDHQKKRITHLERLVKELTDVNYGERVSEIKVEELKLAQDKLEQDQRELEERKRKSIAEAQLAKWKTLDEGIKTFGNVAKAASVIIPALITLHKTFVAK